MDINETELMQRISKKVSSKTFTKATMLDLSLYTILQLNRIANALEKMANKKRGPE